MKKFLELEKVKRIVFSLIPEEIQKQKEKDILSGKTLTLKERFIKHWKNNGFECSKYKNEEDLKRMILYCWSEYWDKYDICTFDDLFI